MLHPVDNSALFHRDGGTFFPTELTTGPWRGDAMHGGPPSALIGVLIGEALEADEIAARINIDLDRPVPLAPLMSSVVRRKVSRRVSKLDIELSCQGVIVVRAGAVLLRGEDRSGDVAIAGGSLLTVPGPEASVRFIEPAHIAPVVYSRDVIEIRKVSGGFGDPLPTVAWIRATASVVTDEPCGALAKLLAVADFGSPFSQTAAPELEFALINVDVSLALTRHPVGSWFLLDATREISKAGVGVSISQISDIQGKVGVITQSQLIQPYG